MLKIVSSGILIAGLLFLTGCKEEVIDYQDVKFTDGVLYTKEGQPFTGKVNHFPDLNLGVDLQMDKFKVQFNLAAKESNDRSQAFYDRDKLCTAHFRKGLFEGEVRCMEPDSSAVRYVLNYKEGRLHGQAAIYDTTGKIPLATARFNQGLLEGVLKTSTTSGALYSSFEMSKGKLSGKYEVFDPASGKPLVKAHFVDDEADGEYVKFTKTGILIFRGTYDHGKPVGVHEEFEPDTGALMISKPYNSKGQANGVMRVWRKGQLMQEVTYVDGKAYFPDEDPDYLADPGTEGSQEPSEQL